MSVLSDLALGFAVALTLQNIAYCFAGVLLGTLVGVLPGIGPVTTVAVLLPISFTLPPESAMILLAGIYYGAQYGGSTTAILVNIPGEASSVVTTIDGHAMARQGRAGPALGIAALGSFFAGCAATLLIALAAPPLATIALQFGPAEYFSLMVCGLIAAVVLARGSLLKAIAMVVHPWESHHGDDDRGTDDSRHSAGSARDDGSSGTVLGAHRQHVARQSHACGTESSAGRHLGEIAACALSAALSRHHRVLLYRRLYHQQQGVRRVCDVVLRNLRLRGTQARVRAGAAHSRLRFGADDGGKPSPRSSDFARRSDGFPAGADQPRFPGVGSGAFGCDGGAGHSDQTRRGAQGVA